ncbi:hypothetical protein GOPIP_038_00080 [Gordonia polyisoprenivorans NBRC 16320 = JCM 10675]|nr:hypothetical protein GOPIP_038_00080 [Gordonia polyisoprenivorans NBRC 16320 = JCM 10675]
MRLATVSTNRTGPFWDVINGFAPPAPAAALLGWTLRAIDPEAGTIEVGFSVDERFTNPVGHVQGGFLAAMLDDTLGPALVATLGPDQWAPTASLHVQFLAPAQPGLFVGHGRIVRKGNTIAFLAGELFTPSGTIVATANATTTIRSARAR